MKFTEKKGYYIGFSYDYSFSIINDGKDIGTIVLSDGMEDGTLFIEWIGFNESERGKGHMKNVLNCLTEKFNNVTVVYAESNEEHLQMYKHLGFEEEDYDDFREMYMMKKTIREE